MKGFKVLKTAWVMIDSVMVVAIFSLAAMLIYGSHASKGIAHSIPKDYEARQQDAKPERGDVIRRNRTVSAAPVAYERSKAAQIARNMVSSEVTALPVRQTLDMRESDNKYLMSFSLPKDVTEEDLTVDVVGNILTLVMESDQKTYLQRVRIPCDFAGESSLNHYISNQLLVVEISK